MFELDFELGKIEDGVDNEEPDAIIDDDRDTDEDDGESFNFIAFLAISLDFIRET